MSRIRGARWFVWLLAALLTTAAPAWCQPCRSAECIQQFPDDAGSINVRDFGAKGDGSSDDTAALLAAIAASGGDTGRQVWHDRLVYLPPGTYLVSGTLLKRYANEGFASGMILVGYSVDRTVIRLQDHAPGFSDPLHPRPVVMTTSKRIDHGGGRDYEGKGEGNDAYENFVENLTIDVGVENPGAIGIDYLANNIGAVRDVVVRAGPSSGATGIVMLRKWPGPALLQRVAVDGFDVGIDVANTEYGMTLSRVRLRGQRVAGLRNTGNAIASEDLDIAGDGPAVINRAASGLIVLTDATLSSRGGNAVQNEGSLVFRDVAVRKGTLPEAVGRAGRSLNGWLSGQAEWHQVASPWRLAHPQAPLVAAGSVAAWAHVAPPADDDPEREDATDRLQAVLRSGASTVYLPHGTYWISASLEIPPSVHRILGMNSTIRVLAKRRPGFARTAGMLRVGEAGSPLAIERLALDNTDAGRQVGIELSADRTVLLKDVFGAGVTTLDRRAGGGAAFVEDTCCGLLRVAGPRLVVARQLNSEGGGVRVVNDGARLVVIGIKTEGFCTAVETNANGRTEVLGGLVYVVVPPSGPERAAFVTKDADLTTSFVEESLMPDRHYKLYLSDQQAGSVRQTSTESMPLRGLGHIVPILQSRVAR